MLIRLLLTRCRTTPLILLMMGLCSCGSGLDRLPVSNFNSSASVLYSIDNVGHSVLRYTPNDIGTATLDSNINLPSGLTATLIATDAAGNLYIGGYTTNANNGEVAIYDSGATDNDAPRRVISLQPGELTAIAVDRQGRIYAAQQSSVAAINIYSSNMGEDTPVRTIDPSLVEINDLAVDSAGNVYVSGSNGKASSIREFAPTAAGTAATIRTLWAPTAATFGGLAVDDSGKIFAMQGLTLCEFAADAAGTTEPFRTISLPAGFSQYPNEVSPHVLRRDGLGDFFVPVTMTGNTQSLNMIYGFAAHATDDEVPMLQFVVPEATISAPHGANIPLGVF